MLQFEFDSPFPRVELLAIEGVLQSVFTDLLELRHSQRGEGGDSAAVQPPMLHPKLQVTPNPFNPDRPWIFCNINSSRCSAGTDETKNLRHCLALAVDRGTLSAVGVPWQKLLKLFTVAISNRLNNRLVAELGVSLNIFSERAVLPVTEFKVHLGGKSVQQPLSEAEVYFASTFGWKRGQLSSLLEPQQFSIKQLPEVSQTSQNHDSQPTVQRCALSFPLPRISERSINRIVSGLAERRLVFSDLVGKLENISGDIGSSFALAAKAAGDFLELSEFKEVAVKDDVVAGVSLVLHGIDLKADDLVCLRAGMKGKLAPPLHGLLQVDGVTFAECSLTIDGAKISVEILGVN